MRFQDETLGPGRGQIASNPAFYLLAILGISGGLLKPKIGRKSLILLVLSCGPAVLLSLGYWNFSPNNLWNSKPFIEVGVERTALPMRLPSSVQPFCPAGEAKVLIFEIKNFDRDQKLEISGKTNLHAFPTLQFQSLPSTLGNCAIPAIGNQIKICSKDPMPIYLSYEFENQKKIALKAKDIPLPSATCEHDPFVVDLDFQNSGVHR